jgi:hypothetical protein
MANDFDQLMGANPGPQSPTGSGLEGPASAGAPTGSVLPAPGLSPDINLPAQTLDLERQPKPAQNDFDQLIQSDRQFERANTEASFYASRDQDPDRSAKVFNLARQTGLDTALVDRNYEELSKSREQSQINFSRLARLNPAITALAGDPVKAAAIKDDMPTMQSAEDRVSEHGLYDQAVNFLGYLVAHNASGLAKVPALAYDAYFAPANALRALRGDPTRITSDQTAIGRDNFYSQNLEQQAGAYQSNLPILGEGTVDTFMKTVNSRADAPIAERVLDAATQGNYARAAQVLLAQTVANAPQLVALAGSAMLGVGELGLAGMGLQTAAEKNAANLEAGIDPVKGLPDAAAHGAIVSYLDRFGVYGYFSGVTQRLSSQLGPQVARQVMESYGATLAHAVGAESGKMAGMSLAGDFADYATGVNKDAFAGSIKRAIDTGLVGAATGFATTAPIEGVLRLQEARRAQAGRDLVAGMVSDSRNKVRDRSPELYTEFLRNTVDGTPYAEAQIAPDALKKYFQSKGLDPVAAMQDLGFLDKFAEAQAQGTNVRVPTEQLVDQIAAKGHDDLVDHVTFHEEDPTVAELKDRAEIERLVKEQNDLALDQAESVALDARGLTPEQARAEAGESIRQRVESQLREAGQDPKQAVLISRILETAGQRTGVDPLELYNQLNLSIRGPDAEPIAGPDQLTLQQRADDTAEIAATKEILRQIDSPEKAAALEGPARDQYLSALNTIYGASEASAPGADAPAAEAVASDPRFSQMPRVLAQSDAYRSELPQPTVDTFYSKLERTVADKMPNSAPPDQVRAIVRDVKAEEKKWLGLDDFLKDKAKVSKVELLEFLRANNPEIVDITKSQDIPQNAQVFSVYDSSGAWAGKNYLDEAKAKTEADRLGDGAQVIPGDYDSSMEVEDAPTPTKYQGYSLPGGENYREVLFTLPPEDKPFAFEPADRAEESWTQKTRPSFKQRPRAEIEASPEYKKSLNRIIKDVREEHPEMKPKEIKELVRRISETPRTDGKDHEINGASAELNDKINRFKDVYDKIRNPYADEVIYTKDVGGERYLIRKRTDLDGKVTYEPAGSMRGNGDQSSTFDEAVLKIERQLNTDQIRQRPDVYTSSHWDEANILAFTRLNDRVDAEGNRVLHVEEIQSDWHQEGRKKGYQGDAVDPDSLPNGYKIIETDGGFVAANENGPASGSLIRATREEAAKAFALDRSEGLGRQVPDAPFRKTWHEFALKKIIRMAAEGGYDKVTWTTGEQQAERYDLSKSIGEIKYKKYETGTYRLVVNSVDGDRIYSSGSTTEEKMHSVLGKEMAQKVISSATDTEQTLKGLDLKVGGEGMKGFYDKIVPDYLRKFGKKYGAAVGDTTLARPSVQEIMRNGGEGSGPAKIVHSLEISDALRDAALHQGFELFQGGDETPRGQISIRPHAIDIQLLAKANRSTFIHETGHFVVELMKRLSEREDAPEDLKADFGKLMKYAGNEGGDITVEQHETLARSFEAYLMEGKAPSADLRQAFARFKTWLVDVYRNIRALNVNLTNDVREVFDRILATDEEIAQVSREQNVEPLFTERAMHNLTPEQFAKYQSAFDSAKLAADDELRGKVMNDIRKQETEAYKDEFEAERAKAQTQAEAMPVYQAFAAIQRGETVTGEKLPAETGRLKLSSKAIETLYGEDALKSLKGKSVTARDGLHPDVVADMFGYASGKDLIDDLARSPKLRDFVEETASKAMKEKSPDLFRSPYLPDQAMRAIHNDSRAKVLRLELEHLREQNPGVDRDLTRMVSKRILPDRELKETVRGQVSALKTSELKPNIYLVAGRKAAAEAGDRLAKGDFDGAFEAKRRELVNHELYKASTEAKDEMAKFLKFTKKFNLADDRIAKSRDLNLVNAGRAILASFGIGKTDLAPIKYLERMRSYDPDGFDSAVYHVHNATDGNPENYRDVTFGRFQTMADSVKALYDLARDSKLIEVEGKKIKKEQVVQDLVAQASNHGDLARARPGMSEAVTKFDSIKLGFLSAKAALTRIEHFCRAMDLSDYSGPFAEHIWEPVQKATTAKQLRYAEMMRHYLDKVVAPNKEIFSLKPIEAPELGYRFKNKKELLGALQHAGNLSNLSKLLRGRGWGELKEDGSLDRTRWDQFITRLQRDGTLKKADYDFVQGVWDMYDSIKPEAQVAHKKMYGSYFSEVTNDPFQTPFGEYKGGYAPAVADPNITNDAALRREAEQFGNHGNMMMMPTGGRGFTKSRVEEYAAPLALDLDYVPMAVDKVIRFIHVEPVIKDVAKIVFDRKFADAMNAVAPGHHENMVAWMNRAAKQSASIPSGQGRAWRAVDSFFRAIRTNTGLNAMAGNVVNAIHQTTGLSVVTAMVEPHYIRDSIIQTMRSPRELNQMILEKSEYMRARVSEVGKLQGQIEDLIEDPGRFKTALEWTQKNGYILQHFTAKYTETVAWTGAYSKALAEGKTDTQAINFADSVVRRTQHSLDVIDIARYETGSPLMRMFTQFTGYYNNKANLLGSKAIAQIRESGLKKSAIPLAALYASIQMIPAIMAKSTYKLAEGKFDENDDGHYLDDALHLFFGGQVDESIALVPVVGPYVNYVAKTLNDKPSDDRFVIAPGLELVTKLGLLPSHVARAAKGKGRPSAPIKDVASLIGLLSGLPVAPLAKPIGYLADVQSGKVKSHGALDFARGLITGYGSKH